MTRSDCIYLSPYVWPGTAVCPGHRKRPRLSARVSRMQIIPSLQKRGVHWLVVVERAQKQRVGTAVYTAFNLLNQLIGMEGLDEALAQLRPFPLRQRLLRRCVNAESITAGREAKHGRSRYLLLLLLVDRPRDMLKLIYRTLWPEDEWLNARYSGQVGRWRHVWCVARYGRI